jgi:hypothetical protein
MGAGSKYVSAPGYSLIAVKTINPVCNRKYNFKAKKRKVAEEEDRELEESVRTISALFQSGGNSILPSFPSDEPLEARVASISAEIAAAIVQAQTRIFEEEEDTESGSGQEIGRPDMIRPNTSGIRGDDGLENGEERRSTRSMKDLGVILDEADGEDDDSDAFPIPLRTRKAKDPVGVVGNKRKR